jgi:2-octaprenyl-6-methoxyphenol hydroxylase
VNKPGPIAVVGRGPVGLAAAVLIADRGYDVTLIGPPAPADERTAALLTASIGLLGRLSVWDELLPVAAPLRTLRIVDGTRQLFRAPEIDFEAREIDLDAFGYNVPNARLTSVLEHAVRARGIDLIDGLADSAQATSGDITVTTGGTSVNAMLVVAADGRRSRMRAAAGIPTEEWRYDQAALVCNLRHTEPHHDTSTEIHTEEGPLTLVPLPGNRSSLVLVARPAEAERLKALDAALLATEIERRSEAILGSITVDGARATFPVSGMRATTVAANRTVLVGEAAHVLPPIGAQGLNLGFRDVAALGEVLAGPRQDPGSDNVLADYRKAREADVATRTAAVDALNRTLLSDFFPVQALRSIGLTLIGSIPPLRRFVMRRGVGA